MEGRAAPLVALLFAVAEKLVSFAITEKNRYHLRSSEPEGETSKCNADYDRSTYFHLGKISVDATSSPSKQFALMPNMQVADCASAAIGKLTIEGIA